MFVWRMFIKRFFKHYIVNVYLEMFCNPEDRVETGF